MRSFEGQALFPGEFSGKLLMIGEYQQSGSSYSSVYYTSYIPNENGLGHVVRGSFFWLRIWWHKFSDTVHNFAKWRIKFSALYKVILSNASGITSASSKFILINTDTY